MMFLVLTLVASIVEQIISSSPWNLTRVDFNVNDRLGQLNYPCNSSAPCDYTALLTCQIPFQQVSSDEDTSDNPGKFCQCALTDSMEFDQNLGQCVSLVGEPCGYLSINGNEVLLNCVANAFCSTVIGECVCDDGYQANNNGHCSKEKGFGDLCSNTADCNTRQGFQCDNGVCVCNKNSSVDSVHFEEENKERRCLAQPGRSCSHQDCVPNARCVPESKTCDCDKGFSPSISGRICVGHFGSRCDIHSNLLCERGLSCGSDGVCDCIYPKNQHYDRSMKVCLSLIGGPCSPSKGIGCVSNAVCRPISNDRSNSNENNDNNNEESDEMNEVEEDQNDILHRCECDDGFVENVNRTCRVEFGHPCSHIHDDHHCDPVQGLVCRNGVCSCPDPEHVYDFQSGSCRVAIGANCNVLPENKEVCVTNGRCVPRRNGRLPQGYCECMEDFVASEDRTCTYQDGEWDRLSA